MKVNVTLVVVLLTLGIVNAARRRVRSTTASVVKTTPASFIGRQFAFAEQPEELETLWDNFDIQKLDSRSEIWKNVSVNHNEPRQYPGLPINPGDTNELPSPISTPAPTSPPHNLPPGCLASRGQYSSPKSCANYLNCWDDVVIEQTCPKGLLFNDAAGYCDFPINVKCGDRPPATQQPPLPAGSKRCPDLNGRYRSSTNCSEFYVCVTGKPIKFCCPPSLVYNDLLNVCDYLNNVDCKGLATPQPPKPTQPPTRPSQPPTRPSRPPTLPSQPPTLPSQPPTLPSQPPTLPSQPPTLPSQPPTLPSQPPTLPSQPPTQASQPPPTNPSQPPTYPSQPPVYPSQPPVYPSQPPIYPSQPPVYPSQPPIYPPQPPTYPQPMNPQPPIYQPYPPSPSYSGNPWLSKIEADPWLPRSQAPQLEINKEHKQEAISLDNQLLDNQPMHVATETPSLVNPWTLFQVIPSELMNATCNNDDVHRLNDACTNVIVCRNNKPQIVRCSTGFSYDKPSDSCKPFSIAKC
ncbi:extensin-1-like [Nylanderia fulva]|uniref:extensin-1-like n=1 Tax=Nylanderia fulva TaxID=613905 RepID=UPI0010FB79B0|nr:extensin-1-like [Nylanderia fulva]